MWYGNSLRSQGTTAHSDHRWAARRSNPSCSDVLEATNAAVRVFEARSIPICAVGGLACRLFGNPRTPNDADLVALDTVSTQEQLKRVLVDADSKFYLIPARNPRDTYNVLWYRTALDVRVKVDLLQPGIMSIPNISPDEIEYKKVRDNTSSRTRMRIPVAPFSLVLLLKLQAWEQHRDSSEYRFREKQYTDSSDINMLLPLAVTHGMKFDSLPDEFLSEGRRRVISYTRTFPESKDSWKRLGFKTFKIQTASTDTALRTSTSASRRRTQVVPTVTEEEDLAGLLSRLRVSNRTGSIATRRDTRFTGFD